MGETYGVKMVMQTICAQTRCKSCDKIDTKMRRRAAEVDRIHRWQKEGAKFRASIDKSTEVIRALDSEIYELSRERHRRQERVLGPAFDGEVKLDDALPTAPGPLADRDEDYESDRDTDITSDEAGWDDEHVGKINQRDPRRFGTTRVSNTVASDSGYRSGHGTDTESVCSLMSTGSSTYLSGTLLQEFIASFTKTLIDTSGALSWAAYTKAHSSPEEVERNLNKILKDYAIRLAAVSDVPDELRVEGQGLCHINLANASRLVRQYRSQIARSFSERLFSVSNYPTSLNVLLQRDERQLSLMERIGLLSRTLSHDDDLVDDVSLDPAMEDTIENESEEDLLTILTDLRHSFISQGAFRLLATDVRRRLYRDDVIEMQSIKTIMEEGSLFRLRSGFHEANFSVHWPLKEFMRSQYDGDTPHIGSVIVLTGSALYAQATTCARYVEATWPTCGSYFLNVLNGVLQKATTRDDVGAKELGSISSGPGLLVKITMYESRLSISASALEEEQLAELAQQLAWLGCALRVSPYGNSPAHFEPLFLRKDLRAFEIMFKPSPIHATESACWLPLFCGAVIAAGFPIAERTEGIGLEIPIELLAGISGTQHAVEYEGGVVMKGFSHMFVPIRKTADCVQWHAIMNQHPENRLTYETGISRCQSRAMLPEVSLRDITSLRAIVGWCMVANSKLGSESAAYGNIDYSKAEVVSEIEVHCSGGTLGFQQFGMASLDFRFGFKDGKCHFQRKGTFRKIAQVAKNTPITLYDTGERRAWLVPASEVMLHIIQHRHRLDHFNLEGTCPSIDTSVSSESSAREILVKNRSLSLSDEEEYTFKTKP
jgi:hypothetical protein